MTTKIRVSKETLEIGLKNAISREQRKIDELSAKIMQIQERLGKTDSEELYFQASVIIEAAKRERKDVEEIRAALKKGNENGGIYTVQII